MNASVMRSTTAILTAGLIVAAGSCTGSQRDERMRPDRGDVNPGEVRIASTIVSIDTVRSARAGDPCARHACYATILIDSVLGYGSGFPRPLSPGESVRARFAFTLAPSVEAMPGYETSLPGLEEGDSFRADLRVHPVPTLHAQDPTFVVYEYHPTRHAGEE